MPIITEEVVFLCKGWKGNGNKLRLIMTKMKGEMSVVERVFWDSLNPFSLSYFLTCDLDLSISLSIRVISEMWNFPHRIIYWRIKWDNLYKIFDNSKTS